jgi:hypothetical protein
VYVGIHSLHLHFVAGREGLNRMLDGFTTRTARALFTLVYSSGPGTEPILLEGRTDGRIVPPRGLSNLKFGWGPVFEVDDTGFKLTYVRALMFVPRSLWTNTLFLEVYGDGSYTKKRNFPSGTCAAEVARVPTNKNGRGSRPRQRPSLTPNINHSYGPEGIS